MRITTPAIIGQGAQSDCITTGIGNGNFTLGFSYRNVSTDDSGLNNLVAVANFYTGTTCDDANTVDMLVLVVTPNATGVWTAATPLTEAITGGPSSAGGPRPGSPFAGVLQQSTERSASTSTAIWPESGNG